MATWTNVGVGTSANDGTGDTLRAAFQKVNTFLSAIRNGTTTNDSATAGDIGEYQSASLASGSAASITTAVVANITSVSLTAGDWDVEGVVAFNGGATTTVSYLSAAVSTTSATLPTSGLVGFSQSVYPSAPTVFNTGLVLLPTGRLRVSIASTTTVYLVARASFGTSTCSGYGQIVARRVR
jgi:hypothetical protein